MYVQSQFKIAPRLSPRIKIYSTKVLFVVQPKHMFNLIGNYTKKLTDSKMGLHLVGRKMPRKRNSFNFSSHLPVLPWWFNTSQPKQIQWDFPEVRIRKGIEGCVWYSHPWDNSMHSTMLIVDSSTLQKSMLEALLPIYINHLKGLRQCWTTGSNKPKKRLLFIHKF